jgi:hypothetical protein
LARDLSFSVGLFNFPWLLPPALHRD